MGKWKQFIESVVVNKSDALVLQEFIGAVVLGRKEAKLEKAIYIWSERPSGKSVFTDCIKKTLTQYEFKVWSGCSLKELLRTSHLIADLEGCSLATFMGAPRNVLRSGECKSFISGASMLGKHLYKDPFLIEVMPLVLIEENHQLIPNEVSVTRRIISIEFKNLDPSELDRDLTEKLTTDTSEISDWIIKGKERFKTNGYIINQ